jgi:hypothetical protein
MTWHREGGFPSHPQGYSVKNFDGIAVGLLPARRLCCSNSSAPACLSAISLEASPAYLDAYPDRIRAISLEQVTEAASKYIRPDRVNVIVLGDVAALPHQP